MSHTPGPWYISTDRNGRPVIASKAGAYSIAECYCPPSPFDSRSEGVDNARLIAAAPELLDCLKIFVSDCDRTGIKDFNIPHLLPRARAAIAKAEGKS